MIDFITYVAILGRKVKSLRLKTHLNRGKNPFYLK